MGLFNATASSSLASSESHHRHCPALPNHHHACRPPVPAA